MNSNSKQFMLWFRRHCCNKNFTTCWSGCRVQVWVQVWAPAGHLAISPKAVPEGNQRFRGQNQLPSSWGSSPALHGQVGQASTNTGSYRVGCSHCWQQPACMRKTCHHSGNTDSVQESKGIQCNPVCQKLSFRLLNTISHLQFFSFIWYEPMA